MVIKYSMYVCMCVTLILHAYAQTYKYLLAFILFNIITTDCGGASFHETAINTHIFTYVHIIFIILYIDRQLNIMTPQRCRALHIYHIHVCC